MNIYLLIHNVGFIISAFATITGLFFLLLNNPQAKGHIPLALAFLSVTVFIISHVIGVNITDPEISRNVLMFNLSLFFIGMFNVHAFLALLDRDKKEKYFIIFLYVLGVGLTLWFIKNPDLFLLPSEPKMYYPNYYVPGKYNWIRIAYLFGICVTNMLYILVQAYRSAENVYRKKQLKYLILGFLIAYGFGFIPNLLVYDIQFDPLYGMAFMFLFTIVFLYAAIKYELMNIKVIAKQATIYSLVVGCIGGSIILLEYVNNYIITGYRNFPIWVIPSISVLLVMFITLIVWRKIRQVDLLKYEFITTVTHKFRTPLTQIKWSVDTLAGRNFAEEDKQQIKYIEDATGKLVELTNLLVTISETDDITYKYHVRKMNLKKTIDDVVASVQDLAESKNIKIKNSDNEDVYIECDESRLKFVVQTFLENSLHYTPSGGEVSISLSIKNDRALVAVKDSGIGIQENELPLIFTKFYRGDHARSADTEGMGIGLFITREIIVRHGGKIWVESQGLNKGSTFFFSLPVAK